MESDETAHVRQRRKRCKQDLAVARLQGAAAERPPPDELTQYGRDQSRQAIQAGASASEQDQQRHQETNSEDADLVRFGPVAAATQHVEYHGQQTAVIDRI